MQPLQAAGEGEASQAIDYLLLGSQVFRENVSPTKASPSLLGRTGSAAASPHRSGVDAEQQMRANQSVGGEDEEGVFGLRALLRMAASRDSRTEDMRERAPQSRDGQWQRRNRALDIADGHSRLEDAASMLENGCRPAGEVNARRPNTSLGLEKGLSSPRLEQLLEVEYDSGKRDASVTMPRHDSGPGLGRVSDRDSMAAIKGHAEALSSASLASGNELAAPGTLESECGDWTPASGVSPGKRGGREAASTTAGGGGPRREPTDSDWGSDWGRRRRHGSRKEGPWQEEARRRHGSRKTRASLTATCQAEGAEADRGAPAAIGAGGGAEAEGAAQGAAQAQALAPEHMHATAQVLAGQDVLREEMARLHQTLAQVGS